MIGRLFLVVSGDPSGDLHAASLIRALKSQAPDVRVAAVGGASSRAAADEFIEDLASRGVTGFWEPALKIRFLLSSQRRLGRLPQNPSPRRGDLRGLLRLQSSRAVARRRTAGIPAFYFVSPQVWASRPGRVKVLKRLVQKMLVIFPFEESLYREAGVPVEFVGHPLLDLIPQPARRSADGKHPSSAFCREAARRS